MAGSEQWQAAFDEATANFQSHGERDGNVALVEAEARTGSRYVVAVSGLTANGASILGGSKLVTVIYPWSVAYTVNSTADGLVDFYLFEKFSGDRPASQRFGGDMAGVVLAIRAAIRLFDGEVE